MVISDDGVLTDLPLSCHGRRATPNLHRLYQLDVWLFAPLGAQCIVCHQVGLPPLITLWEIAEMCVVAIVLHDDDHGTVEDYTPAM